MMRQTLPKIPPDKSIILILNNLFNLFQLLKLLSLYCALLLIDYIRLLLVMDIVGGAGVATGNYQLQCL